MNELVGLRADWACARAGTVAGPPKVIRRRRAPPGRAADID
jgi:hypothetical protein